MNYGVDFGIKINTTYFILRLVVKSLDNAIQ